MTSNATDPYLIRLEDAGYREWMPRTDKYPHERRLFVTAEIWGLLDGTDTRFGFAPTEANQIVDRYLAGFAMRIGVGFPTRKMKKDDLPKWEQLANLDEVWAMCVRKPTNGYRLFGRLMDRNLLVLSLPIDRDTLGRTQGPKNEYQELAKAVIPQWEADFPGVPPHRGANLSDYFSGTVINDYA